MNRDDLPDLLARTAYRPGFKFGIEELSVANGVTKDPFLLLRGMVPDTYGVTPFISVRAGWGIKQLANMTAEDVLWDMLGIAQMLESHEAQEWFRVDGEIWSDPHDYSDERRKHPKPWWQRREDRNFFV